MKTKGFTLIELLVVIAIIGLLSSIVLASLDGARARSRGARINSDIRQLERALFFYADDNNGNYPDPGTQSGNSYNGATTFETYLQPLVAGGYIPEIPNPPTWPNNANDSYYVYYSPSLINSGFVSFFECGGKPLTGYALLVSDPHDVLNLPILFNTTWNQQHGSFHCITEF